MMKRCRMILQGREFCSMRPEILLDEHDATAESLDGKDQSQRSRNSVELLAKIEQ